MTDLNRTVESNVSPKTFLSGPRLPPLIWVSLIVLALNALAYTITTTSPFVRSDVWRHLEDIVIPFLEGNASWTILWANHHPSPLLHLIQIANIKLFHLRIDYHAYLGLTFQLGTTLLLLKLILATTGKAERISQPYRNLGLILILVITLGFSSLSQYNWPLVATIQYLYFFGLLFFVALEHSIRAPSRLAYLALILAAFMSLFASANFGTIFILSGCFVAILVGLCERKTHYLWPVLLVLAVWSFYQVFLGIIVPENPYRPTGSTLDILLHYMLHPVLSIKMFSVAIASGLLDTNPIRNQFPGSDNALIFASFMMSLLFATSFIVYLWRGLYRVSLLPLILMVLPMVFSAAIIISRNMFLGDSPWALAAPRYIPTFKLGVVGLIWAIWLIVQQKYAASGEDFGRFWKFSLVLVISIILSLHLQKISTAWQGAQTIRDANDQDSLATFIAGKKSENATKLNFQVAGLPLILKGRYYLPVLHFLESNNLNVFADNYPASPLYSQHVAARELFLSAKESFAACAEIEACEGASSGTTGFGTHWMIQSKSLTVTNENSKTAFLRLPVVYEPVEKGLRTLQITSSADRRRHIKLARGKQSLFFELSAKEKLTLKWPQHASIAEFELRF